MTAGTASCSRPATRRHSKGSCCAPSGTRPATPDCGEKPGRRPPQSSSLLELRWILGSDGRFYNYDHLTERTRPVGVAEGTVRTDFSFFGLRVYDIDPKTWELRDILFAGQAAWTTVPSRVRTSIARMMPAGDQGMSKQR